MGQRTSLRLAEVLDQRPGRRGGQRGLRQAERVQRRHPEVLSQRLGRDRRLEPVRVVRRGRHILHDDSAHAGIVGHE